MKERSPWNLFYVGVPEDRVRETVTGKEREEDAEKYVREIEIHKKSKNFNFMCCPLLFPSQNSCMD